MQITSHTLVDLAEKFYHFGGKRLYIDEIHKYQNWSVEIKNIYDRLPDLQVVYTGSSILELEKGGADLSRRKLEYKMPGLSFREFPADVHPLQYFQEYLEHGSQVTPSNVFRI